MNKSPLIKNLKPFKKGTDERRNLKGAPPKLPNLEVLLAEVLGEEKDGKTAAFAILASLRAKAAKGDVRAAELLMDRAWGKSKQSIEHTGKDGNPIQFANEHKVTIEDYTNGKYTPEEPGGD